VAVAAVTGIAAVAVVVGVVDGPPRQFMADAVGGHGATDAGDDVIVASVGSPPTRADSPAERDTRPPPPWRDPPLDAQRTDAAGGLAVTVTGDRVVAVDTTTDEQRWATRLDELVGGTIAASLHVSVGVDHDAVVVTTPHRTVLLDRHDGSPRWVARSVGWQVWAAVLLDDRIVLRTHTGRGGSPLPRLEALDRATGAPVWDAVVAAVVDVADDVTVTRRADGTVVGLDPRDGSERWRAEGVDPALRLVRHGTWLTAAAPDGRRLLAAASGRPATDADLAGSTEPGGRWPAPDRTD